MKTSYYWVIVTLIILGCAGLYFYIFNDGLSTNAQDWAAFGSYFNGIIIPLLTTLNIYVFIKLTTTIENNQENRHKQDTDFQKCRIISEMRQKEIDNLSMILNEIGMQDSPTEQIMHCSRCQFILISLMESKQILFPIEENNKTYQAMLRLNTEIKQLGEFYQETLSIMIENPEQLRHHRDGNSKRNEKHINLLRNIAQEKRVVLEGLLTFNLDNINLGNS